MSSSKKLWREGKLSEVGVSGSGFIEENTTGRAFGFHRSMLGLKTASDEEELEGQPVRFVASDTGSVDEVELVSSSDRRPMSKQSIRVNPRVSKLR